VLFFGCAPSTCRTVQPVSNVESRITAATPGECETCRGREGSGVTAPRTSRSNDGNSRNGTARRRSSLPPSPRKISFPGMTRALYDLVLSNPPGT
jgi:hypothetical protein